MALKDWKLYYNGTWAKIYKSRKQYPVNHLFLVEAIVKGTSKWGWRAEDNKDMSTIKQFKTKSAALKYAHTYMRLY